MFSIKLTDKQLDKIADISRDIGQAFFVSSFIPFITGVEDPPIIVLMLTLTNSFGCWIVAIAISGKGKYV